MKLHPTAGLVKTRARRSLQKSALGEFDNYHRSPEVLLPPPNSSSIHQSTQFICPMICVVSRSNAQWKTKKYRFKAFYPTHTMNHEFVVPEYCTWRQDKLNVRANDNAVSGWEHVMFLFIQDKVKKVLLTFDVGLADHMFAVLCCGWILHLPNLEWTFSPQKSEPGATFSPNKNH